MNGRSAKLIELIVMVIMTASFCESLFVQWEYSEIPRPPKTLVPCETMVDVTNDLTYKTLYYHSIANRNNFAFSPTALVSVLIAIFEGSNGRSCKQIQNALGLPWNTDVVRIGYRDIHRRLRTYFFEQENPLTGLSLNRESVTITREYEAILKFYGYDLGADMILPMPENGHTDTTTKFSGMQETTVTMASLFTTSAADATNLVNKLDEPNTTSEGERETTALKDENMTTSTEEYAESTSTIELTTIMQSETNIPSTSPRKDISTAENESINNIDKKPTQTYTSTEPQIEVTTLIPRSTTYIRTFRPILNTTPINLQTTSTIRPETPVTLQANQNSSRVPSAILPARRRPDSLRRNRRSYSLEFYNQNSYELPFSPNTQPIVELKVLDRVYFAPRDIVRDHAINQIFYLNTHETVDTTYKVYNSILNYNYIDVLRSSMLELELDSNNYSLMLLIPDYGYDLDFLLSSLKSAAPLRHIRHSMQQKWVQAIIPDFQLKGQIFLTNDMQFLGISDIFEPLRADFSPMTKENGVYVKHIEQSINVHIRTNPIDQLKRNTGPFSKPIEISANHPFLFFIVDKELSVATMAGSVINPLNVRIL